MEFPPYPNDLEVPLTFAEYQRRSQARAIYPNRGDNIVYPIIGICGEAGEVAEKLKKVLRDKGGVWSDDDQRLLVKELGDVLWYIAAVASELKIDMQDIADANLDKVDGRHERGTLQGSGDDR